MRSLGARLKKALTGAKRVAVLAIGAPLRRDDAAGLLVADELAQAVRRIRGSRTSSGACVAQPLPAGDASHPGAGVPHRRIRIFHGETAPENLTGEIKRFAPTHLIVLDAADAGRRPGYIVLMEPKTSPSRAAQLHLHRGFGKFSPDLETSVSTHNLPLSILVGYLEDFLDCRVLVIGIQPKSREFGQTISPPVAKAVQRLSAALAAALRG